MFEEQLVEICKEFGEGVQRSMVKVRNSLSATIQSALLVLFRTLPRLKECEGCEDLPFLIAEIDRQKCHSTEFLQYFALEVTVPACPNQTHEQLYVQPAWNEKQKDISRYLIPDLVQIVVGYAQTYSQQFHIGLLVAILCLNKRWFLGTVTQIATVGDIPFIFVEYVGWDFHDSSWVPAGSNNIKCFYTSEGERIEKAEFLGIERAENQEFIDIFCSKIGRWERGTREEYIEEFDFAVLGTFTR